MSNFERDHPINHIDPTTLGVLQGKALAKVAIELRRHGLSLEEWQTFMDKRLTEIASAMAMDRVPLWRKAFAEAYGAEIDRVLSLEGMSVVGHA